MKTIDHWIDRLLTYLFGTPEQAYVNRNEPKRTRWERW